MATVYTGCVKWFNNNLNYGFITVLSAGDYQNKDIFVHQSNIKTKRDCYRTLTINECVQFEIAKTENEQHPIHAVNVHGFNNVLLNCENPAFRGRFVGGFRGGRGGGRGGYRGNGGARRVNSSSTQDSQTAAPTDSTTATNTTTPSSEPVAQTTTTNDTTKPAKGRGRKPKN